MVRSALPELPFGPDDAVNQPGAGRDGSGVRENFYETVGYVYSQVIGKGAQPVLDTFHQFPVRSHVHQPVHGLRSGVRDPLVYLGAHCELDVGILSHGVRHFMDVLRASGLHLPVDLRYRLQVAWP